MFDELVESAAVKEKTNTVLGVAVSAIIQVVVVGFLVLIPLIYTQALPKAALTTLLVAPLPPPPPPPPPPPAPAVVKTPPRVIPNKFTAPREIPKEIVVPKEPEVAPPDVGGGQLGGVPGGVIGGVPGGMLGAPPPPVAAPPPPPAPVAPSRIKQGGDVTAASIISKPTLPYPTLAQQTHTQGDVVLHAIISKQGSVEELKVISGNPLLVQTAMEMVKQWRYKPTLLNGQPVEVETTITVQFRLAS